MSLAKPLRQILQGGSPSWRQLRMSIDFKAPEAGPAHAVDPIIALCLPWPLQISQLGAVCRLPGIECIRSSFPNPHGNWTPSLVLPTLGYSSHSLRSMTQHLPCTLRFPGCSLSVGTPSISPATSCLMLSLGDLTKPVVIFQ